MSRERLLSALQQIGAHLLLLGLAALGVWLLVKREDVSHWIGIALIVVPVGAIIPAQLWGSAKSAVEILRAVLGALGKGPQTPGGKSDA
jgi:hypothetical protein